MITLSTSPDSLLNCTFDKTVCSIFSDKPTSADISFLSSPEEAPESARVISWPGEYDIAGIAIKGVGHEEGKKVSFVLQSDGVRCAFLAFPLHEWTDDELAKLGNVDVLVIPAGNPKLAQKLIDEIDPRVLVPLKTGEADAYQDVLKHCGATGQEVVSEHKIKGLPQDGRDVVVLG